jgi:hypothetical protein
MMMEQILDCPLAVMNAMEERMEVEQERTDAIPREMKAEIRTNQEEIMARLEAKIEANNEKSETLQGTPVSQTDAHHAKTEANHELMATMKVSHERINALTNVNLEKMEVCIEKMR